MKNYAGYKAVKAGAGRPVYVREDSYELFSRILKEHRKSYHFTTILRTVNQLSADGLKGKSLNLAGDAKVLQSGNISMRYNLHDGAVFIQKLTLIKEGVPVKTGLYSVSYSKPAGRWIPSDNPIHGVDGTQSWPSDDGKAHYAAVAGRFDVIQTASHKLPKHIIGAYQKANLLTKSGAGTGYSLFWSQKGSHKSAEAAEALASVMQQSTQNELPVNWLIHGDGIHTFTNAAKILKSSAAVSRPAFAKSANIGKVQNQNVYFSNPASSISKESLKRVCEEAGLTFLDVNTNNRDLRRWSTLVNVGKEMAPLTSRALVGGGAIAVAQGAIGAVGFDKAVPAAFNGLASGDYFVLGAAVAATGYAAHGAYKRTKVIAAGVKCTIGRGNEEWYTDDNSLFA